jgi:hypothetical protein
VAAGFSAAQELVGAGRSAARAAQARKTPRVPLERSLRQGGPALFIDPANLASGLRKSARALVVSDPRRLPPKRRGGR